MFVNSQAALAPTADMLPGLGWVRLDTVLQRDGRTRITYWRDPKDGSEYLQHFALALARWRQGIWLPKGASA